METQSAIILIGEVYQIPQVSSSTSVSRCVCLRHWMRQTEDKFGLAMFRNVQSHVSETD